MLRSSVKHAPWKAYKAVTAELKQIYQPLTDKEALLALNQFAEYWDYRGLYLILAITQNYLQGRFAV